MPKTIYAYYFGFFRWMSQNTGFGAKRLKFPSS
jgi:hypothetical protein